MKINKFNLKKAVLAAYLIFAVLFSSGSVYGKDYTTLVQISNSILFLVLAYLYSKKQKMKNLYVMKISAVNLYLLLFSLMSIVNMIFWNEFSMFSWYVSQIVIFFDAYFIVKLVPYREFRKVFVITMIIISVISLIGWVFTEQIIGFAPSRINVSWDYRSFYVFVINAIDMTRNYGIFREPGVFAGFLALAMMLVIEEQHTKKNNIIFLVFGITLFTTASTTGYFLLLLLFIYYINSTFKGRISIFVSGLLFLVSVYLFFNTDLILQFIKNIDANAIQKIETENVSFTTRIYSMQYDMIIALQNPFGIGPSYLSNAVSNLVDSLGHIVDARTSAITTAFVMYGLVVGCLYTYIILIGCLFREQSIFKNILIATIVFITINTQPHFGFLATACLLFYWYFIAKTRIMNRNQDLFSIKHK